MRTLIIFYFLIIYLPSCSQSQNSPFVERIIGDYSRSSYYILVSIKSPNKDSLYLIENDDLFYYYHQKSGYSEKQYQEYIGPVINEVKSIIVADSDIKKYGFEVISLAKVESEMKKGRSYILQEYFENRILKDGISIEKRNLIIAALFRWKLASRIDDESGYLVYNE